MSIHNLHIFNDASGFYTNVTAQRVLEILKHPSFFINLHENCQNKRPDVVYGNFFQILKRHDFSNVQRVYFHGYEVHHVKVLDTILELVKGDKPSVFWIFWSHEFYQLPENLKGLYTKYTIWYGIRKFFSFYVNYFLLFFQGKAYSPLYPGLKNYRSSFSKIDFFCSLIEGDYRQVDPQQKMNYLPISYLNLSEIHVPEIDFSVPRKSACVMLRHSASPLLNHEEILDRINKVNLPKKVLLPVSYGKKNYILSLRKSMKKYPHVSLALIEQYMPKEQYYKMLEKVDCFILNTYCQQALGNIMFFLATGAKVFLRKSTSTYQTLTEKGFVVFSIEDELTIENLKLPMRIVDMESNRRLLEEFLADDRVYLLWKKILF